MRPIYLDYNCFQRPFDNLQEVEIMLEALSCLEIFYMAQQGKIKIIWSFMHADETMYCPFPERKFAVLQLATLSKIVVPPEEDIRQLALLYQKKSRLLSKDSIHIACAQQAGAAYFLTCDKDLIKRASRLNLSMSIINPVDYLLHEVYE